MPCKECDGLAVAVGEGENVHFYIPNFHMTIGSWHKPFVDAELCSYHRRKAEGHFDRDPEHFRFNRGPHEWTHYESFYPPESPYVREGQKRGRYS